MTEPESPPMSLVSPVDHAPELAPGSPMDPTPSGKDRARWTGELLAVLGVYLIPAVIRSLAGYLLPQEHAGGDFLLGEISSFVHSSSIVCFGIFLMWRSGEPARAFGFVRPHLGIDGVLALAAFFGARVAYYAYAYAFWFIVPELYPRRTEAYNFGHAETPADYAATFLHAATNGTAEEIMLWGLLFTRLCLLSKQRIAPAILVAAFFASYHLYQGPFVVGGVFCMGLVHAAIFLRFPRLWPLILAHVLADMRLLWR
jgi:hypothetical protein